MSYKYKRPRQVSDGVVLCHKVHTVAMPKTEEGALVMTMNQGHRNGLIAGFRQGYGEFIPGGGPIPGGDYLGLIGQIKHVGGP